MADDLQHSSDEEAINKNHENMRRQPPAIVADKWIIYRNVVAMVSGTRYDRKQEYVYNVPRIRGR